VALDSLMLTAFTLSKPRWQPVLRCVAELKYAAAGNAVVTNYEQPHLG
jgi:hypothetical protein